MITLLCTDITVDKEDILRIYANRWSIEVMFKVSKDLLNLNKEFKAVSFDMIISHISIVFTYMILEYIKKNTRRHQILNKKPVLVL
jgi:transposase, IS4 family protein